MIEFSVFPGGKKRVLSFSYDDGLEQDERLIKLFNRYGMKGSFNLNGYRYVDCTEEEIQRLRDLYRGHEVACRRSPRLARADAGNVPGAGGGRMPPYSGEGV